VREYSLATLAGIGPPPADRARRQAAR